MKAKGGQMIKSMGGASWISGKGGRGKIRKIIKDKLARRGGGSQQDPVEVEVLCNFFSKGPTSIEIS